MLLRQILSWFCLLGGIVLVVWEIRDLRRMGNTMDPVDAGIAVVIIVGLSFFLIRFIIPATLLPLLS